MKFSSSFKNSFLLEKLTIIFFVLLIAGGFHKIEFISKFNPSHLLIEGQPPGDAFIITTTVFSATLIALHVKLRLSLNFFLNGLTYFVFFNPFLAVLILLTPISAFWSTTPLFTLARGLIFAGVTVVAVYFGTCYQWNDIFNFFKWGFAFAMLQSTFLALVIPSLGVIEKGWQGSFSHAGTLGIYAAFTSLLWLIQFISKKKGRLLNSFILGLSIFVLLQTNSATGLILLAQGIGLVLVLNLIKKLKPRVAFLVTVISLPILILTTQIVFYYINDILVLLGRSPDLTGRGEFWPQLIQKLLERPILGYGFEGFWIPWVGDLNPASTIINHNFYVPSHAHNGFLDLALNLGILGLILYLFTFIACAIRISKSIYTSQDFTVIPLIFLLFIVVANMSGDGLWEVGFHSFLFVLVSTRLTLDSIRPIYAYTNLQQFG